MAVAEVMQYHDVANIFPMMGDEEYRALVADIKGNGLLEPVWIYQDKIIDGRNRYKACLEIGIKPQFREWDGSGSLVSFVVSLNLKRRHLTSSQKAMIAIEVEAQLAKEASEKERQRKSTLEIFPKSEVEPIHAAKQAAAIVGTNHHYVTDAKKIVAQVPELKEAVLNGTLTIPEAKREVLIASLRNVDNIPLAVPHISSKNNEWYTPLKYIVAAHELMGGIDLDPASCKLANETVKAAEYYDISKNGLDKDWLGRVWLNPPYGYTSGRSNQDVWSSRLIDQFTDKVTTEAILLVNAAVDTTWFHRLFEFPVCLTLGRINFTTPEPVANGSTHGSAFVYFGSQPDRFFEIFSEFGTVVRRW